MLLGSLAAFVLRVTTYVDPPPEYTSWQEVYYFVLVPVGVGIGTGILLSAGGLVGGWLGCHSRQRTAGAGD